MAHRLEWRSGVVLAGNVKEDVLLEIDEENDNVLRAWRVRAEMLIDFLNNMTGMSTYGRGDAIDVSRIGIGNRGDVVMARAESGEVLTVNPQLYWEGIAFWFRSRGDDPHRWTELHREHG